MESFFDPALVEEYGKPSSYNPRLTAFARAPNYGPPEGMTRLAVFNITNDYKIVVDVSDPKVLDKETDKYQAGLALTMKVYTVPTDDLHSYVAGGSPKKIEVAEPTRPMEVLAKRVNIRKRIGEHLSGLAVSLITTPTEIPGEIAAGARDVKHAWQQYRKIAKMAAKS